MNKSRSKFLEEQRERFLRHLSEVDDLTLVVLKGHLLMEELLNDIIADFCELPEYVEEARLSFFHKSKLVRALSGQDVQGQPTDDPWRSLEALNSLRNQLAHHLEPKHLEQKIDQFIFARFGGKNMVKFESEKARREGLRKELIFLLGYIQGRRSVTRIIRES